MINANSKANLKKKIHLALLATMIALACLNNLTYVEVCWGHAYGETATELRS